MIKFMLGLLFFLGAVSYCQAQFGEVKLIAHRGGVVDDGTDENSLAAIAKASYRGYYMVELDVRMTKDSVLVVHHDRDLVRFFNVHKAVSDLTWGDLQQIESPNGHKVQKLETMLVHCKSQGLQVMIDLKIQGNHPRQFEEIFRLLRSNGLAKQALVIPSEEATGYFRGKIKLSCTRSQIEIYQHRQDYAASHYYLFANPSQEDFDWAVANDIQVVGAINYRESSGVDYLQVAEGLRKLGVPYVQLDSRFDVYFKTETN